MCLFGTELFLKGMAVTLLLMWWIQGWPAIVVAVLFGVGFYSILKDTNAKYRPDGSRRPRPAVKKT